MMFVLAVTRLKQIQIGHNFRKQINDNMKNKTQKLAPTANGTKPVVRRRTVTLEERGWAGHFICSDRCLFKRNTLLKCGEERIVVSTVGNMVDIHAIGYPSKITIDTIGSARYYETMAFHAKYDKPYWDADVSRQVDFKSDWAIGKPYKDNEANEMHDKAVSEIRKMLERRK